MQISSSSSSPLPQVVGTTKDASSASKSVPDAVNLQQQADLQAQAQKDALQSNAELTGLGQNLDTRA